VLRVSVDIGGTFTDMVVAGPDGSVEMFKAPSTHGELSVGVMDCLKKAAAHRKVKLDDLLAEVDTIIHGTTVTTNALLTRAGALTGMITSEGFRDIIEMRRGMRVGVTPYNLKVAFPEPLVPRHRRLTVPERLRFDGSVITPLDEAAVERAARELKSQGVQAIAVCFLFSYVNSAHERRAAEICRKVHPDAYVTTSSDTLSAAREFERFNTAIVGAYTGPIFSSYIDQLDQELRKTGFRGKLVLIQSNGGIQDKETAKKNPVSTLLSGPAAGPSVGVFFASAHSDNIISVDMGGTSFEAALVRRSEILLTTETWLSQQRIATKLVDVHSIGAGGGSIAWFDPLKLLRVGPQSAGSRPGSACYGNGGTEATVTDANLLLGYISPDYFLGGEIKLKPAEAERAVGKIASVLGSDVTDAAYAIYDVVNESMADALNERCTKRGFDPREFVLVAAGGAGGLHAANIAAKARIKKILIPKFAAAYCAFGMQLPDYSHDYVRSYPGRIETIDPATVNALYKEMEDEGRRTLATAGVAAKDVEIVRTADLRYVGQFHEVGVPVGETVQDRQAVASLAHAFHERHHELYGFSIPERPVELLYLRLRAIGRTPKVKLREIAAAPSADASGLRKGLRRCYLGKTFGWREIGVYDGDRLLAGHRITGPALIEQRVTTVMVPDGFRCDVDAHGNYLLEAL
jgi:N-methylhydantoinase A